MTANFIPLSGQPEEFSITLGNNDYDLYVRWSELQGWVIDISDSAQNLIVANIPLVMGVNLLSPFDYLNFGGALILYSDINNLPPTYNDLGTDVFLYYVTAV